jgi:hypothetical protein
VVLVIDGDQALVKRGTALERERIRTKALGRTTTSLETLETRIASGQRLRKSHFGIVQSGLVSSFYWPKEHRTVFAQIMRGKGWTVIEVDTEADGAIAIAALPGDPAISSSPVTLTFWRMTPSTPFRILFLVDWFWCTSSPRCLDPSAPPASRWRALVIVSKNDYTKNIFSLGPAINYRIIKNMSGAGNGRK